MKTTFKAAVANGRQLDERESRIANIVQDVTEALMPLVMRHGEDGAWADLVFALTISAKGLTEMAISAHKLDPAQAYLLARNVAREGMKQVISVHNLKTEEEMRAFDKMLKSSEGSTH